MTHLSAVIYFIVVDPWWKRASFGDASAEREVVCESIYSVDLLTPWVVSSSFGGGLHVRRNGMIVIKLHKE